MRPIYGVSSKYDFGRWDHVVYVFEDRELAEKWLYTEEYDFLEDLRNTMNMSQAELAKKYNISVRTIQNWDSERRNPPDYVIKLLAYTIFLYQLNREGNKDDSSEQD